MKKVIFLFPGQGSQEKNMIINLYNKFSIIRNTITYGSKLTGYNILNIIKNTAKLNDTIRAQPIILIISVAIWRLWNQKNGIKPTIITGHSLGEYTALVCNNRLSLKNMINLIVKRAMIMKLISIKNRLLMMSILNISYLDIKNIYLYIKKKYYIEITNVNSKKQVVISFKRANIFIIKKILNNYKIKHRILKMNVVSHCKIMFYISKIFNRMLSHIKYENSRHNIIHNLNINHCGNLLTINHILIKHLYKKVMWLEIVKYLEYSGIKSLIECGPSVILKKLVKKMVRTPYININNYDKFRKNMYK